MAGWGERPQQAESLFNSHNLRKNYVIGHDIEEHDDGLQRLEVDGVHIRLDFVDDKTLSFKLRQPKPEELESLEIHWLTPRKLDKTSNYNKTARRTPGGIVPKPSPWEERLANSPELITVKTLDATTQYCEAPVEMEQRENPRQHRKSRLHALHPRRVTGRTDSDTFFASVKLIRNFAHIQIFLSAISKFLYVKEMRKESHSHGAYQDFIRDVGASNVLLTDNSQTQSGVKWTRASRENVTKQIHTVPHNQNQNQAERKV